MTIGIIGVGKIACAMVEGLCSSGVANGRIYLSPRNEENSKYLATRYAGAGVSRLESNQEVLDRSEIIFIALRPAMAKEVLSQLVFGEKHIVISLIPLLKYADLSKAVFPAGRVSRAIPLPSVRHHNCPIPIYHSNEIVTGLFRQLGQPLLVPEEEQLHTIWTLTGLITPFYDLLNELSGWAITNGVGKEIANAYIGDLFQALSFEAQQAGPAGFAELAEHAQTPNGMNEQAGREIREQGAHAIYRRSADHLLERFK
ncbi:MAG TPA: NAD(P)-binding domain-containing protein [Puia sp.]|nr:NAD(P)-binding domain-containing protein [Puia sp.]